MCFLSAAAHHQPSHLHCCAQLRTCWALYELHVHTPAAANHWQHCQAVVQLRTGPPAQPHLGHCAGVSSKRGKWRWPKTPRMWIWTLLCPGWTALWRRLWQMALRPTCQKQSGPPWASCGPLQVQPPSFVCILTYQLADWSCCCAVSLSPDLGQTATGCGLQPHADTGCEVEPDDLAFSTDTGPCLLHQPCAWSACWRACMHAARIAVWLLLRCLLVAA